jgi:hypothetical protein
MDMCYEPLSTVCRNLFASRKARFEVVIENDGRPTPEKKSSKKAKRDAGVFDEILEVPNAGKRKRYSNVGALDGMDVHPDWTAHNRDIMLAHLTPQPHAGFRHRQKNVSRNLLFELEYQGASNVWEHIYKTLGWKADAFDLLLNDMKPEGMHLVELKCLQHGDVSQREFNTLVGLCRSHFK